MRILHGNAASPFVRKVVAVLTLKELEFERREQLPFANDPEYLKINPLGKIPSLEDGDHVLCDSTVICEYLEDAYPNPSVYPVDPIDRARARWLEELSDATITDLASGIFFQRIVRPQLFKKETDEAQLDKIINKKLPPLLDYVESQVPKDGFIFGNISVADISLVSPFINAAYAGYEVDPPRWPRFADFIGRVRSHPAIDRVLIEEAKILEGNR